MNSIEHLKKKLYLSTSTSKKVEEIASQLILKGQHYSATQTKSITGKENHRPISLMNVCMKTHIHTDKMLSSQIRKNKQDHIYITTE